MNSAQYHKAVAALALKKGVSIVEARLVMAANAVAAKQRKAAERSNAQRANSKQLRFWWEEED
jgi:hypothetical protein